MLLKYFVNEPRREDEDKRRQENDQNLDFFPGLPFLNMY
jgi:hypothetical protein